MRILFKILEEDLFELILNVPVNNFSVMLGQKKKTFREFRNFKISFMLQKYGTFLTRAIKRLGNHLLIDGRQSVQLGDSLPTVARQTVAR